MDDKKKHSELCCQQQKSVCRKYVEMKRKHEIYLRDKTLLGRRTKRAPLSLVTKNSGGSHSNTSILFSYAQAFSNNLVVTHCHPNTHCLGHPFTTSQSFIIQIFTCSRMDTLQSTCSNKTINARAPAYHHLCHTVRISEGRRGSQCVYQLLRYEGALYKDARTSSCSLS